MHAIILILAALLFAADAEVATEIAQLDGEWSFISAENDGRITLPEDLAEFKRVANYKGEAVVYYHGQISVRYKFTVDPSTLPKTIDYEYLEPSGITKLGIYEVDGDTLKVCYAMAGQPRPTEFISKPGTGWTLVVCKRDKKMEN